MKTEKINPKTRSHRIRLHRIMWRWLSEDGDRRKIWWPGWEKYAPMHASCFLCGPRSAVRGDPNYQCCPLIWPGESELCMSGGLYSKYNISTDRSERARLAKLISELPVRPLDRSV